MKTNDDIESYLLKLDYPYQQVKDGLWIIHSGAANIVVAHTPPVIVFRVKMFDLQKGKKLEPLYRKLLELNAKEMVQGAYGIENESVVLVDSLQSENLDMNEFQAAIDSLSLAVHNHHDVLAQYHEHVDAAQG